MTKRLSDGNLIEVEICNCYNTTVEAYEYDAKEGETIIILGAHKGGCMLKFAKKVGEKGKIVALEAAPKVFLDLMRNLTVNNYKNVIPLCFAIWDKNGAEQMWSFPDHGAGHTSQSNSLVTNWGSPELEKELVLTITWDTLVSALHLKTIDYCKCNVEGAEIQFLKGMTEVLPKFIAIQAHQGNNSEVIKFLAEKSYQNIRQEKGDWIYANSTS